MAFGCGFFSRLFFERRHNSPVGCTVHRDEEEVCVRKKIEERQRVEKKREGNGLGNLGAESCWVCFKMDYCNFRFWIPVQFATDAFTFRLFLICPLRITMFFTDVYSKYDFAQIISN